MANISTFSLPKETQVTLTFDDYSSGHYVIAGDPGSQPTGFTAISAGDVVVLGPYNDTREYRITLLNGSYTSAESFLGAEDQFSLKATITDAQENQTLIYDPEVAAFVNGDVASLSDDDLMSITSPADKQVLIYNNDDDVFENDFVASDDVTYDHTISGLAATDVKAAIDEVFGTFDDYTNTAGLGTMAFETAADYTNTAGLGTMAFETAADYTNTAGLGTMAFETATDYATQDDLEHNASITQAGDVTASGAGPYTLASSSGACFKVTVSHDCTLTPTFTSAEVGHFMIQLVNGGAHTIIWTGVKWAGGTPPSFTSSGTDLVELFHAGDNNIYGTLVGADYS